MGAYNISQIAEKTGLTAHTLRYYEKETLIRNVPRDSGGRRYYSERHLKVVRFVNALRATNMPIREIKRYLTLYEVGESTHDDRLALLESHRRLVKQQLETVKVNLNIIDKKIKLYISQA